jgi:hypothetical protein
MPEPVVSVRREFSERYCRIAEADRTFDLEFWQSQSTSARLQAAWDLVVLAYRWKGANLDELRLQRSVEAYGPIPS